MFCNTKVLSNGHLTFHLMTLPRRAKVGHPAVNTPLSWEAKTSFPISPSISDHKTSPQSQRFCFCSDDPVIISALLTLSVQFFSLWRSKGKWSLFLCIPKSHKRTLVRRRSHLCNQQRKGSDEDGRLCSLEAFGSQELFHCEAGRGRC